jgi:hypothetical protein
MRFIFAKVICDTATAFKPNTIFSSAICDGNTSALDEI